MSKRDEQYILDLCDEILGTTCLRQHRFDFLRGDRGHKLPVDGYYPSLNLAIEYLERQHIEAVKFFDARMTVSGVPRGRQRYIYDQRRRDVLPKNGIQLIELTVTEFPHRARKRLVRIRENDLSIVRNRLASFIDMRHFPY